MAFALVAAALFGVDNINARLSVAVQFDGVSSIDTRHTRGHDSRQASMRNGPAFPCTCRVVRRAPPRRRCGNAHPAVPVRQVLGRFSEFTSEPEDLALTGAAG